ncbi:MAG: cyclic nucleotide-binding domain-containing protein [Spirochaetales bacterium]|nr:MAG: cyclic nucleotide-binding domain-containing protein [Spirochaetales bacterium]
MADHFAFLREVYFFKDLSDDEVRRIERLCKEDVFEPGQVVFRENEPAERFFIVTDGQVEVWKDYASDNSDLLAVHGQGHLFGEMALIDDLPRSATVVARTRTTVLYLFREEFDRILRENSAVALSILRSLSAMVRKSNESFVEDLRRRNDELEAANKEVKEAQEELLRSERFSNLGKMSSMILHDIRNPISIVKGLGEMIQLMVEDPAKVREYANLIVLEAERLNRIAGELLDYSRGEIRLDMRVADIPAMLTQLEASVSERFASKKVELKIVNSCDAPVILDQERLLRALINIADNARKAMDPGGRLEIDVREHQSDLQITALDDGVGMSDEVLERIFEPFYSSSRDGGTGLGMVIVKNVIEAHEGSLSVESTAGQGTRITIQLPMKS